MNPVFVAAIAPILWGSTYAATALYLPADQPFWMTVYRALPVGIAFLLIRPAALKGAWLWRMPLLGVLNMGLFYMLLFVAAYRLPSGMAGTFASTLPIQALIIAWLFKGERPGLAQGLAALLGVFGVSLLLLSPGASVDLIGAAAALSACFLVLVGMLLVKKWGMPQMPIISFIGWQMLIGGLFTLPFALMFEGVVPVPTGETWIGLIWVGLFNTGLSYIAWFWALDRLPVNRIVFIGLLNPLSAVTLGQVLVGESFTTLQWLGLAIVPGSIVLSQLELPRLLTRFRAC